MSAELSPDGDSDVMARLTQHFAGEVKQEAAPAPSAEEVTEEVAAPEEEEVSEVSEELEDVEINGAAYKVPTTIKSQLMNQQDYTRKSQEVADMRRQVQAQAQSIQLQQKFQTETADDFKKLNALQARLDAFKALDWSNMDSHTYGLTKDARDTTKEEIAETQTLLKQKAEQFQQAHKRVRAEQAQAAYEFIGKHVKGFTPDSDVEKGVARFVANYGVSTENFADLAVHVPGIAVLAAKAKAYDELQTSKSAAVTKVKAAPPVVKPGAASNTSVQQRNYQKAREALKKDGSVDALQRALMIRGIK
jgi:hypothetical protein